MYETIETRPYALLVAVQDEFYDERSLVELSELVETAGAEVLFEITQNRSAPDKSTCVGMGKLQEIKDACAQYNIQLVVFDNALSPTQLRNVEEFLQVKTIDRSGIILEIFALHAKSAEGKVQVELAQLNYLLPRLRGDGVSLSRLAGGIGTRGPGETKLETDRRHILRRIQYLKDQLNEIRENRSLQRQKREKNAIPVVAIAGYTNAGKSTLMNRLTDAGVFVENRLFATLDSTTRKMKLPNGRDILLSDTVGFIRNLPHELIFAFQSTLEEIKLADLVLLVCDVASDDFQGQLATVRTTIEELGYHGPVLNVYNKSDLLGDNVTPFPAKDCTYISAQCDQGIARLLELIQNNVANGKEYCLQLGYDQIAVYYALKEAKKITAEQFGDAIVFSAILSQEEFFRYHAFIISEP